MAKPENVYVKVVVTGTRTVKDMNREFEKLLDSTAKLKDYFKDLETTSKFLDAGYEPPPIPELSPMSKAFGTYLTPEEELALKEDTLKVEEALKETTAERLKAQEDLGEAARDYFQSARNTTAILGVLDIDEDKFAELRAEMENIVRSGSAAGFKAAITGGDVRAVFEDTLANIATAAFMEAAGNRLSSLLVGGGIPFIPFLQKGGYTGEYEGLAYLHRHEFVINEDIFKKVREHAGHSTSIPASILRPPAAAPGASQALSRADIGNLVKDITRAVKNSITVELKGKAGRMFDVFVHDSCERGRMWKDVHVSK
jgi:hypothetical protein